MPGDRYLVNSHEHRQPIWQHIDGKRHRHVAAPGFVEINERHCDSGKTLHTLFVRCTREDARVFGWEGLKRSLLQSMIGLESDGAWSFAEPSYAVLQVRKERRFFAYREQQLAPITQDQWTFPAEEGSNQTGASRHVFSVSVSSAGDDT